MKTTLGLAGHSYELTRLFAKAAWTGDPASARDIEDVLVAMAPPKARDQLLETLRHAPALADVAERRPLLPPGFGADQLEHCGPGTLGEAYVRSMRALDPMPEPLPGWGETDHLANFRRRVMEAHDIWDVIADCPADIEGELGVIGFYFGHFARYLTGSTAVYNVVLGMNLAAGLLYISRTEPRRLLPIVTRVLRNVYRGYLSTPLFSTQWEPMWDQPGAPLQDELLRGSLGHTTLAANGPRPLYH